jgi:heme/copper-type cytochrome/quinol oxidase subunit 2
MRGFVTVQTPEAFQAWMDEQQAGLAESTEDSVWN